MSNFPMIVGSQEMKDRLGETIRSHRLSHAYLIEGRRGSGKKMLARQIAAAISCERIDDRTADLPCSCCDTCKRILGDKTPDVRYVGRGDKATLSVDTIRELRSEMALSSTELEFKTFVIDDAETMTPAAQNALLISLEEPPPNVLILLLAETAEALLPTIRSRVQLLRMGYVDDSAMRSHLLAESRDAAQLQKNSPDKLDAVISASDGRIGEAMRLLTSKTQGELLKKRQIVTELVIAFAEAKSFSSIYSAIAKLPSKRAELSELLTLACDAMRDLCSIRRFPEAKLLFFLDRNEVSSLASRADIYRLFRTETALRRALGDLAANANVQITLTALATAAFAVD